MPKIKPDPNELPQDATLQLAPDGRWVLSKIPVNPTDLVLARLTALRAIPAKSTHADMDAFGRKPEDHDGASHAPTR
jgi:hypothetical protein